MLAPRRLGRAFRPSGRHGGAFAKHLQQFPLVGGGAGLRSPRGGITTMTYQWPITVIHLHITEAQRTR